jgi:nucleoside-diphosphate-sugar epimerase
MQTILGAGGAAGTELAKQLINYTDQIRIVSRKPQKVNDGDQLMKADLSDSSSLEEAIKGSEIVYVTIGFEYNIKVWKEQWPRFTARLLAFCKKYNCKIVFVDNIYMLDKNCLSNITEETPINPSCEKGIIRSEVDNMILGAINKKEVNAIIARGADFYGPGVQGSYLTQMVLNNINKNKPPQWIGNVDAIHSFTYSKDIGKALALLGNR